MVGTIINGKYRLTRLLGKGGMGAVYEAQHVDTGRRLAVKIIHKELINDAILARFEREARAAGAIETQHIAEVIDAGKDAMTGTPYLVMEYLDGEDLDHLLQRLGPLPVDLALRIVAQACIGLEKAHEAGVVHRDIKPGNLFLAHREEGEIIVKLVDFGIAKIKAAQTSSEAGGTGLTHAGSILGTPLYMSPEQARGLADIDFRTDVWSLGVVLYRALAGCTPHDDAPTFGDLIAAILGGPPRPVRGFAPWVPPEVAAIVERAMAIDPAARYPSIAAMHDAIKALLPEGSALRQDMLAPLSEVGRSSRPPGAPASTPPTAAPAQTAQGARDSRPPGSPANTDEGRVTTPPPSHEGGRSSLPLALGAAGVVAALALAGLVAYRTLSPATSVPVAEVRPGVSPGTATVAPLVSSDGTPPVAAPLPENVRRVKLVILPSDASVEIEGKPARARNGVVEITGPLGSVYKVRLFKGRLETEDDVIVTESGAIPPKLELGAPRPPRPTGSGTAPGKPAPRETFQ